ncbi:unnamed protein product [Mycena citricolor]|uniref:Major facilitator superfamily (MFS) profile domain-containing protein n=1 Tax=Mycena citricolor TaxID=2018698 RepID=A0AAD2GQH6_9AGAR|nr:unnamed protein product [Mycena citricolor]
MAIQVESSTCPHFSFAHPLKGRPSQWLHRELDEQPRNQNGFTPRRVWGWRAGVSASGDAVRPPSALVVPLSLLARHCGHQHHLARLRLPVQVSRRCAHCSIAAPPTSLTIHLRKECLASVGEAAGESGTSEHSTFRQIMTMKTVHLIAAFILIYVGVEVTIGGWIVTYIIEVRGGGRSSGYVSAGFFGGLMLGRIGLLWLNQKVGERRVIFIYSILAVALELVVWLVPSLIGDAVAVSIVGVLLGPIYPLTMNHTGRVLPGWLLTGSIGYIAGLGQAGSAIFPFMTGAISSRAGIKALQPVLISMMVVMIILWALISRPSRKID